MKRLLVALALLAAPSVNAQTRVVISDVGPGAGGRVLEAALKRPHRLVEPDTSWFVLPRSRAERTTLIILGRTAAIAGKVDGDIIVVGGDLFVRPGAEISGQGVAIGGGVYPSSLSFLGRGAQSFHDYTYTITRTTDGYRLAYQSLREDASPPLLFPGVYGLRIPAYDRVNGLSVPFGPTLTFAGGLGEASGIATYRSDLGKVDPRLSGHLQVGRRSRLVAQAERGTFSNDAWIWPHYVNSFSALVLGIDTRNHYRADRAELTIHRVWETTTTELTPFVGGRVERAWPVGPGFGETRSPWSAFGRTDSLGMVRPNPAVPESSISSVLAGYALKWDEVDFKLRARTSGEIGVAPATATFAQLTSDLEVGYLTFGEQHYAMEVHWVTTPGDAPPPQRFSYFGGAGTMPFLDLLEQGGDELLLVDQRYSIPLLRVRLGMFGSPTLQLRHRLGSAGLGKLPSLEQMIGVGLSVTLVRGEFQFDPSRKKVRFSTGFTFSR